MYQLLYSLRLISLTPFNPENKKVLTHREILEQGMKVKFLGDAVNYAWEYYLHLSRIKKDYDTPLQRSSAFELPENTNKLAKECLIDYASEGNYKRAHKLYCKI